MTIRTSPGDVMNDSLQTTTDAPADDTTTDVTRVWCDLDERFFRIVAEELPARFLAGATALLGSYDEAAV
jgi:hypothetical protein